MTSPQVLRKLIGAAGEDLVLVGGQALAFWVTRYGLALPEGFNAISADSDFLARDAADRDAVERFAHALGGGTLYPARRALTALVGQAFLDLSDDEFINVDVIFEVFGIPARAVRQRAVEVQFEDLRLRVMHPLDVLRSRVANLHKLAEKQNPKGVMQLRMAIDMVREFIRDEAKRLASTAERSPIQPLVSEVERLAVEDAGRKVAARFGPHVADAIDPSLVPAGPFWERRWPALRALMSPGYAAAFKPPVSG